MSDVRKELLRQMKAIRERMDPKLLERAKLSVFGKVPYDRDTAREAVDRFLETKQDGGAFRRKLEAELRKEGVPLDLGEGDLGEGDLGKGEPGKGRKADPADPADSPKRRRIGRLT